MKPEFAIVLTLLCSMVIAQQPDPRLRGSPVVTSTATQPVGADIVFILDGSGSVKEDNFKDYFIPFIYQIASQLSLGRNGYQIAIVQFGNKGKIEMKFNESYNARELEQKALGIRYMNENTNTTGGLLETIVAFKSNDYGARGGRWAKIGIILTDGECTYDCGGFSTAAEQLKANEINMLPIGIGNRISMYELETIATDINDILRVNSSSGLRSTEFVRSVLSWITDTAQNNQGGTDISDGSGSENMKGADVFFIIDGSESISEPVFRNSILPFVSNVSTMLMDNQNQIGIITYGSDASLSLRLDGSNMDTISSEIAGIEFGNDMTNTSGALRTFRSLVTSDIWRNASRAELPIIGVLITDGRSSLDSVEILPEAMRIKEDGVHLMAIVVGEDGDIEEDILSCSVSEPTADNFMKFSSFNAFQTQAITLLERINMIIDSVMPEMSTTQKPTQEPGQAWSCDFEDENAHFCNMEQSTTDNFDWSRGHGWTKSFETGPYKAFTGDYYIFIEASGRARNDEAIIYLPRMNSDGVYCLNFAYNMYGFHIRRLEVIRKSGSTINVDWQKEGNQNSDWYTHKMDVTLSRSDQLGFRAVRGDAHTGDIAIDTIEIQNGAC